MPFSVYISAIKRLFLCLGLAFLLPLPGDAQFYDGSNMTFGKNRIQYQEFYWQYYRFDNYDTYFYEGGKELAARISEMVPEHLNDIQNKLDYVIQDRIEFLVYTSHSDFKQSNLGMRGMAGDSEIGGSAQIVGTKVFVYYDGNEEALIRNLRRGIAELLVRDILYGGDWKEVVKNSALLNLPDWYTQGLISYLVDDWTPEIRDRVADGVRTNRYSKFNRLSDTESAYAGFSLWRYIADVYGPSVIPNIIYMTRISRNLENGFIYVIGTPMDELLEEHQVYYSNFFDQLDAEREDPDLEELYIKTKDSRTYSQFKLSPDGKRAAFVSNELGQYKVYVFDVGEFRRKEAIRRKDYGAKKAAFDRKERAKQASNRDYVAKKYKSYKPRDMAAHKIFRGEHRLDRIVDETYPILEWNPRGTELAFITEAKGTLWLNIYSLEDDKVFPRELFGLDKVVSFDYSSTGREMVFSGVVEGQSDLYRYYLVGNRQERLTDDYYDDLDPRFVAGNDKIVFASTRPNDTLLVDFETNASMDQKDIFVLDLSHRDVLERITSTPSQNEIAPFPYDSIRYSYLSDRDLIYDRYVAEYDSAISRIDTAVHYRYFTEVHRLSSYRTNPIEYDIHSRQQKYTLLNYQEGDYRFYVGDIDDDLQLGPATGADELMTDPSGLESEGGSAIPPVTIIQARPIEEPPIDIHDYRFLDDGEDIVNDQVDEGPVIIDDIDEIIAIQQGGKDSVDFVVPSARNYELNFALDRAEVDLTNSFSFDFYQSYRENDQNLSPGVAPVMAWGMSDLFEDRHIIGSIGLLGGLTDVSYGLRYDNLKKRLDKSLLFQRQSNSFVDGSNTALRYRRTHSHILRYLVSYPFSEVFSARADVMGRYQRNVTQVVDDVSLREPNEHKYLGGGKFQLIYDNTLDLGLNLRNGTRGKVWAEYYRDIDIEEGNYPDFGVIGFDIRHYQRLHREIQFAARVAGNTSFGQQRLINFLGGVDNWIIPRPRYDDTVPIDATQNYTYQALIMPMRGFYRNARNGTSAAVANAELRVPFFKYVLNKPIQSDFVENFQVLAFSDVGAAWTGSGPYADDNSFNTSIQNPQNQPSVTFILQNQEDPLLASYGFGLRSRLLGYFIRADWAWGIVDGRTLPAEFYLSLNLDF